MATNFLLLFICILFSKAFRLAATKEWGNSEFNGSSKNDQWSLENLLRQFRKIGADLNLRASESWQKASSYKNFDQDWKSLKEEPLNPTVLASFLSNTTLPCVYIATMRVKEGWIIIYKAVMDFTKRKCDKLLGSEAPMHPWNLIKQNKETVSFVVFVYAVGLATILIRLCSFWNFMGLVAAGYTVYIFGGPYLCFRWFVFITGSGWFLLDTILAYPLQSAIIFLVVFFWSNISSYVTGMGSSKKQISEYRSLKGKVERLERRTEELKNRLLDLEVLLRHQEAEDS